MMHGAVNRASPSDMRCEELTQCFINELKN